MLDARLTVEAQKGVARADCADPAWEMYVFLARRAVDLQILLRLLRSPMVMRPIARPEDLLHPLRAYPRLLHMVRLLHVEQTPSRFENRVGRSVSEVFRSDWLRLMETLATDVDLVVETFQLASDAEMPREAELVPAVVAVGIRCDGLGDLSIQVESHSAFPNGRGIGMDHLLQPQELAPVVFGLL